MDTSATYRTVVKDVISHYAKLRPSHGQIRLDTVFDEQQDHYALISLISPTLDKPEPTSDRIH